MWPNKTNFTVNSPVCTETYWVISTFSHHGFWGKRILWLWVTQWVDDGKHGQIEAWCPLRVSHIQNANQLCHLIWSVKRKAEGRVRSLCNNIITTEGIPIISPQSVIFKDSFLILKSFHHISSKHKFNMSNKCYLLHSLFSLKIFF